MGGRSDGIHAAHALGEQRVENAVVAALVLAAQDDVDAAGEGLQGLDGGVHVGRLGVVVIVDPGDGGHKFQAVLDRLEVLDRGANPGSFDTGKRAHHHCRQHIFEIMRALQSDLAARHHRPLAALIAEDNLAAADKRATLHFPLAAEPIDTGPQAGGEPGDRLVIGIQYREIGSPLIFEDARLGREIVRHAAVAIEVVRRKVQNGGDARAEALDRLQLKAGNLEHHPGIGRGLLDKTNCGGADVAAHQGFRAAGRDHLAGQAGGRGLAVRTGNGDDLALEETRRQFDFAYHRRAFAPGPRQLRQVRRHSGADDNEVLVPEGALAVLAGFDRDALVQQRLDLVLKLLLPLGIGDGNARPPPF